MGAGHVVNSLNSRPSMVCCVIYDQCRSTGEINPTLRINPICDESRGSKRYYDAGLYNSRRTFYDNGYNSNGTDYSLSDNSHLITIDDADNKMKMVKHLYCWVLYNYYRSIFVRWDHDRFGLASLLEF